jgi:hypothetical protein
MGLALLLDGWVRLVFEGVILVNLAVLGFAYYLSLGPARAADDADYPDKK